MRFENERVQRLFELILLYDNLGSSIANPLTVKDELSKKKSARIGVYNKMVTHLELLSSTLMAHEPRSLDDMKLESMVEGFTSCR
jgi:hypothetical protein